MSSLRSLFASAALTTALVVGSALPASAGLLPSGSFEVFVADESGAGWVINHIPIRGDVLWGCADVKTVDDCHQVHFDRWTPATKLSFLHVSDTSMKGWLKMSIPIYGDLLLACQDPKGNPSCQEVELELRPPLAAIDRVWPDYECDKDCGVAPAGAGGGGSKGGLPIPGLGGGGPAAPSASAIVESASRGNMWLQANLKLPGPINLYACRNLETKAECRLTVPDFLFVDRAGLGLKKLEEIKGGDDDNPTYGPGVRIVEVEEDSAAQRAKLRAGDVVVKAGGFAVNRIPHLNAILAQYPATYEIPLELENGDRVKLKPIRKSSVQKAQKKSSAD